MQWFFIALSAPFLWALVNISDQYLVSKYANNDRSPGALVLFSSLIGILATILIGIFVHNVFDTSLLDKVLLMTTGFLTILWVILYLLALEIKNVSAVVPWFLTVPIFGFILGYIFLGESLLLRQQIGSIIILCGVIILFFNFSGKDNPHPSWKVAMYMIPACFIIAVTGVIFKYVTIVNQFWISSFWEYAGLGLSGIFIFFLSPKYQHHFLEIIRQGRVKIFSLNIASEIATIVGNLLTNYAILLAPVALVYLVDSFQPAILLILTIFCTKFFPRIVKENMSNKVLYPKMLAIGIIIFGSLVLFFR